MNFRVFRSLELLEVSQLWILWCNLVAKSSIWLYPWFRFCYAAQDWYGCLSFSFPTFFSYSRQLPTRFVSPLFATLDDNRLDSLPLTSGWEKNLDLFHGHFDTVDVMKKPRKYQRNVKQVFIKNSDCQVLSLSHIKDNERIPYPREKKRKKKKKTMGNWPTSEHEDVSNVWPISTIYVIK